MTNANPKVSVVCAWYNRADYIRDTVDSVLAQDFDDYEIVIVNDGSTDPRVREVLNSYNDRRLRVIHQENTGFVGAIRRAIEESSAPFIAIQGAGDVSFKTRLSMQAQYLQENLECIGLGCRREQVYVGGIKNNKNNVITGVFNNHVDLSYLINKGCPFSHGEVMFRREIYNKTEGYRDFFKYAQDMDLWLRLAEHGHFAIINDVLYQRRTFDNDGVSGSPIKTLAQIKLALFAVKCAQDRDIFGKDLVEILGPQAALFYKPNRHSAKIIAGYAAKYLYYGHKNTALFFAEQSLAERHTVSGLLIRLMIYLSGKSYSLERSARWAIKKFGFKDQKTYLPLVRE